MASADDIDPARGERVRRLRVGLGKTVPEVAREVGVSPRAYNYWEEGRTIRRNNLVKLAAALDSTPRYIDPDSGVVGPRPPAQLDGDAADRLNRQREILRRVAAKELLTARQLEYLEQALDELEHPSPGGGGESAEEDAQEAA